MAKCSLCGGDLDNNKRCTFCGLDNTKNDDMYKHLVNQNDCKNEPLTHIHGDAGVGSPQAKTYAHTSKNHDRTGKRKEEKSALAKIVTVIALVVTLGSSVFELIDSLIPDDIGGSEEETLATDPYENVPYDLPETGMDYSIILQPGIYTVGTHLPQGTYEARVVTGNYGMVEINDYNNGIYLYENIGELDEQTMAGDLRLYKDGHFVVSNGIQVELISHNIQSLELFTVKSTLTKKVILTAEKSEYVAGVDFSVGVYDIHFVPGTVSECGSVEYTIPMGDYDSEWAITFGETGDAETYHNVVLPANAKIRLDGLSSVTLIPSALVAPVDIEKFYETF